MAKKKEDAQREAQSSMATPIWETVVMVGSFVLAWAWFLAYQTAVKASTDLAIGWKIAAGITVLTLIVIMVRRLKRLKRAFEEGQRMARGAHGAMPWMPTDDAARRRK